MSDYEDYDYTPGPATDGPKQKGISADTVMQFRKFVLGGHSGPIEPLIDDRPEEQTRAVAPGAGPAPRQNGRFPPGQSGNPKGRPKKGFSPRSIPAPEVNLELLAGIVRKILDREMAVTRDGELLQKTIRDIMFEKQVQKAAQGSTAAARFLHALDMQASQAEAAARAKDYAIWRDRKERYAALHERERKRSGASLYWGCPHPDDIILGPGHTVKVLGPMDPKALQRTKERYERATYWLLLATYEGWLQVRRAKTHPGCPHIHAELVSAYMFEAEQELLPPRLRMPREAVVAQVEAWSDLAGRAIPGAAVELLVVSMAFSLATLAVLIASWRVTSGFVFPHPRPQNTREMSPRSMDAPRNPWPSRQPTEDAGLRSRAAIVADSVASLQRREDPGAFALGAPRRQPAFAIPPLHDGRGRREKRLVARPRCRHGPV